MTYDDEFWRHIWADLEPGDLPGDLETLARGMGMDGTRRLTEYQRGQLYVPARPSTGADQIGRAHV